MVLFLHGFQLIENVMLIYGRNITTQAILFLVALELFRYSLYCMGILCEDLIQFICV